MINEDKLVLHVTELYNSETNEEDYAIVSDDGDIFLDMNRNYTQCVVFQTEYYARKALEKIRLINHYQKLMQSVLNATISNHQCVNCKVSVLINAVQ